MNHKKHLIQLYSNIDSYTGMDNFLKNLVFQHGNTYKMKEFGLKYTI